MKFDMLKSLLEDTEAKEEFDIDKLINYIKSHGHKAWADGNVIKAEEHFTKDGESSTKEVTLKPNVKAIRNWLGY